MSRRIEVELTSSREDGTWTWRAAGAREPKGTLSGSLLPTSAAVGDVVRAEVEVTLDGTVVLSVLPPKGTTPLPELLELLGTGREEPLVTTVLAPKREGRRDRGERGPRRDRAERAPRGEGERGPRRDGAGRNPRGEHDRGGDRRPSGDRPTRRPAAPATPPRPKAKRLRAGRTHRNAVLATLSPEERTVAEQVLRAGIPGVRQSIEKQNEQARADGLPEVHADALLALAEQLQPKLRVAEWHDRAEAALADIDELDLRDLRTVVVAAADSARDDETRALAEQLRVKLTERVDAAQQEWLTDLRTALDEGRTVRALKISSRPPKAGVPVPPDLLAGLTDAATAALTTDAGSDRWKMLIEALAFSPVHSAVVPEAVPASPSEDLLAVVRKSASRVPALAAKFGIEAPTPGARRPRKPPRPPKPPVAPESAEVQEPAAGDAAQAVASQPAEAAASGESAAESITVAEVAVDAVTETPGDVPTPTGL